MHTPGPWVATPHSSVVGRAVMVGPLLVAAVPSGEANASLIAAAPLMFAALLDCVAALERSHADSAAQRNAAALNARAAIAKAEGR